MGETEKKMQFHQDPLFREELIRDYLLRRLDAATAETFESHYLSCDKCFEELLTSEALVAGLGQRKVELRRVEDVLLLQFAGPAQLTRESFDLAEFQRAFQQKDTKVLIDLSRVTKIDSAGLGQLISCYSHAVKNRGMVKLLNPTAEVQTLLRLTKIDSVLEAYYDERQAFESFSSS
jgi:anti-sigma B factor antagonist